MEQSAKQHGVRAIILAAGFGSRLRPLTDHQPKCLTPLFGRPLLDYQEQVLTGAGITDITLVSGHLSNTLQGEQFTHIVNREYSSTNMVYSLFCARHLFDGSSDIIVSYGDIVYEPRVLTKLMESPHPVGIAVDQGWFDLWQARMEAPLADAETLKIANNGLIKELGKRPTTIEEIEGQYIGLIKVSACFQEEFVRFYDKIDANGHYDGKDKQNMFMTSFVQLLIDSGIEVGPAFITHGWLEVDCLSDLEAYERLALNGELEKIFASPKY